MKSLKNRSPLRKSLRLPGYRPGFNTDGSTELRENANKLSAMATAFLEANGFDKHGQKLSQK